MQAGELFANRYRLIKEVGRGSFGEVWQVRDEQLDLEVALKVYIALDERGLEEFKGEYKNTYALNHPNLLHATYFGVDEKRPYLVMPYCPASAVGLLGEVDEGTAWRFLRDVAGGLAYLHGQDILHRDIKPDNILRNEAGDFVITDFGISLRMRSTLRRNSTRKADADMGGSIPYMGPEMFSANPQAVKATDIWALGVSLFELMSGDLPFFGQGGGMLLRGAEIPAIQGHFSDELKKTVQSCLAKETWNRPTAEQLRDYAEMRKRGYTVSSLRSVEPKPDVMTAKTVTLAISEVKNYVKEGLDEKGKIVSVGNVRFGMVYVEGGKFLMTDRGIGSMKTQSPSREVVLSGFFMGQCQVTQGLWETVMGKNPSHHKAGDDYPVENINWVDAQAFIENLNAQTGLKFRLPVEEEWEYAMQGGRESKGFMYGGSNDVGEVAWYGGNSGDETHPVGQKKPNELGLYDMSGNVWEWCDSSIEREKGTYRVLRGGCCAAGAVSCRISGWSSLDPDFGTYYTGLRLALEL